MGQGIALTTRNDTLDVILSDMSINLPALAGLPLASRKFCSFTLGMESVTGHFPIKFEQRLAIGVLKSENASAAVVAQTSVGDIALPPLEIQMPAGIRIDEDNKSVEFQIELTPGIVDPDTWCTDGLRSGTFSSRIVTQGLKTSDGDALILGQNNANHSLTFTARVEWLPCPLPPAASTTETTLTQ
jgi:hypothetical protein